MLPPPLPPPRGLRIIKLSRFFHDRTGSVGRRGLVPLARRTALLLLLLALLVRLSDAERRCWRYGWDIPRVAAAGSRFVGCCCCCWDWDAELARERGGGNCVVVR